jgi:hypothetical protein
MMIEKDAMNAVHWTVKYLLHDGDSMTPEMIDISIGVMSGVIQNSYGVPKMSALHVMSILLSHAGEPGFAAEYIRMTREEAEKVEFSEHIGIEYQ